MKSQLLNGALAKTWVTFLTLQMSFANPSTAQDSGTLLLFDDGHWPGEGEVTRSLADFGSPAFPHTTPKPDDRSMHYLWPEIPNKTEMGRLPTHDNKPKLNDNIDDFLLHDQGGGISSVGG